MRRVSVRQSERLAAGVEEQLEARLLKSDECQPKLIKNQLQIQRINERSG